MTSTAIRADKTDRGFRIGLYLEHLFEASFLYEQRLVLLDDPELTWLDLDEFENRFEAHIDALVVGGDLAFEVCRQQAREGDAGELHAAMRVLCRQRSFDTAVELLEALDPADEEKVAAAYRALCQEMPSDWLADMVRLIRRGNAGVDRVLVETIGYRRLMVGKQLVALHRNGEWDSVLVRALGRLREPGAQAPLGSILKKRGETIATGDLLMALLRLGDPAGVMYIEQNVAVVPSLALPLAIAGSRRAARALNEMALQRPLPEYGVALGLCGDPAALACLLGSLAVEELAGNAALGLYLLTGADLFVEVMIPEELTEDELFDDEIEAGVPASTPSGTIVTTISTDVAAWRAWLEERRDEFQPGVRYRLGRRLSPAALVATLESTRLPRNVRQLAYEELVIRYRLDIPFESDMPVRMQLGVIAAYRRWCESHPAAFEEGKWYFAARLLA